MTFDYQPDFGSIYTSSNQSPADIGALLQRLASFGITSVAQLANMSDEQLQALAQQVLTQESKPPMQAQPQQTPDTTGLPDQVKAWWDEYFASGTAPSWMPQQVEAALQEQVAPQAAPPADLGKTGIPGWKSPVTGFQIPSSWAAGPPGANPPNVQDLSVQGTDQNAAMLRSGGPDLLSAGTIGPITRIPGTSEAAWAQTQAANMSLADWFRYQAAKGTPQTSYYGPTAGPEQKKLEQAALAEAGTPIPTAAGATPVVKQPVVDVAKLTSASEDLKKYISNLQTVKNPTAAQKQKLADYQTRLSDYSTRITQAGQS